MCRRVGVQVSGKIIWFYSLQKSYNYSENGNSNFKITIIEHICQIFKFFPFDKEDFILLRPMKTTFKQFTIKSVAVFIVMLMIMLIVNKALFLHTHTLSDGTVVEHSHPFNKPKDSEPVKSHHHSDSVFAFFQELDSIFIVAFFNLALLLILNRKINISYTEDKIITSFIIIQKGRAPPVS